MGANSTTSVPVYVAGEVLTAADLNVTNSGIPVFDDATARTNAFGGTGEKVLAEGQYAYLEDDNKTYVYDGAAWQQVGASALILVTSQVIGSGVSSVTVSNCFSSTYENYLVTISGGAGNGNISLRMTLGSTTANYFQAGQRNYYDGSAVLQLNLNSAAYWENGTASTNTIEMFCNIFQPNAAKRTSFYAADSISLAASNGFSQSRGGFLNDATQYTSFTITTSTGTLTGGTIRVYGYQNS